MRIIESNRGRWARMLTALLLGIAGCVSSTTTRNSTPEVSSTPDAFDSGADRPPTAQTLYSMGKIMASQGRDADCEAIFARIIKEYPGYMPAYSALAEVMLRTRRVDGAISTLASGLRSSPKDAVLLNDIGMCYMITHRYNDALRSFTVAVSVSPSDARYRANMAAALGLLGRYDESLSVYLHVLPVHEAHYNLGVLCEARKDAVRAAEEFRQAAQLRQGDAPVNAPGAILKSADEGATAADKKSAG